MPWIIDEHGRRPASWPGFGRDRPPRRGVVGCRAVELRRAEPRGWSVRDDRSGDRACGGVGAESARLNRFAWGELP